MATLGVDQALAALGVDASTAVALDGSRSGAGVYRVQLDGRDAVLKTSRADDTTAHRELEVYLTLAEALPVRTPTLLAHVVTADAVVLLLSAHGPPLPAAAWATADWLRLADDLARLHDADAPDSSRWPGSGHPVEPLLTGDRDALLAFWSRPGERSLLERVLAEGAALTDAVTAFPTAFLHGDCHPDNLLHDADGFVWADWQSAGFGRPASDLAFPSVRVTPAGVRVPYDAVLPRYADARGLDRTSTLWAVAAAELAIFVAAWPPFAVHNSAAGVDRVHDRVVELARQWLGRAR